MTDEARMADDDCTTEVQYGAPTRVEFECAIEAYGVASLLLGKWKDRYYSQAAWQEITEARAEAERELTQLLDRMPWGDA